MKPLAVSAITVLMFAGCGGTATSTTTTSSKPGGYRAQVDGCLQKVGYKTRAAGNALRVERPTGELIANVQFFKSQRKAAAFARQLAVPGARGGRAVAVWLGNPGGDAKSVVAGCLSSS